MLNVNSYFKKGDTKCKTNTEKFVLMQFLLFNFQKVVWGGVITLFILTRFSLKFLASFKMGRFWNFIFFVA